MADDDSDRTPQARSPSGAMLILWGDDAAADARRCDDIELRAAELAAEFRSLADAFRAWEHSPPDVHMRNGAYAKLLDLRARLKELGR